MRPPQGVPLIRALSVWQPWASLIILGKKKIETRSWKTAYRGPLLIHAAKATAAVKALCHQEPYRSMLAEIDSESLPTGCILGQVTLSEIWTTTEAIRALSDRDGREIQVGDYGPGRFGWVFTNPQPLKTPLPWRGERGLFDISPKE